MTQNVITMITIAVAALTDAELHVAAANARTALWQVQTAVETELLAAVVELIDAELITRARVGMAAYETALTA